MSKNTFNRIGALCFIVIIAVLFFKDRNDKIQLRDQGVVSKAKIISQMVTKSTLLIKYSFVYNKTSYENSKGAKELNYSDVRQFLINREFPLILLPENPDNNELLIFKHDFQKYNLPYPDSLKWISFGLLKK
jgi:hypothetical protein